MENGSHTKFSLNIPSSPQNLELGNFYLLSETESDRIGSNVFTSQLNELKAQLEIVNEDRERLKKENEKLKTEKNQEISKILASQKMIEHEKANQLQVEIFRLKKEIDEKDMLLGKMRKLLGTEDLGKVLKENRESKTKILNLASSGMYQSRIPGKRTISKPVRSISPYSTCKS